VNAEAPGRSAATGGPRRSVHRIRLWPILVLWAAAMAPLAVWGLPGSPNDQLLFGSSPPWPPERYHAAEALDERRRRRAGADTDLNPIADDDRIICITAGEAQRAEILRRYRLFSRQPDEMITFMALQRMRPREADFDPKLYQYGGAYIYMIGAALGASAAAGLVRLSSDAALYLSHPEAFARFYIVARCVTLLFGALLMAGVHRLARRAGGRTGAWIALAAVAASPVFISCVLEAKPHVPSACLIVWASLAALDYRRRQRRADALRHGLLAGGAFSLVLTGAAALLAWPALWLARRGRGNLSGLLGSLLIALGAYAITNPYVIRNALFDWSSLSSNAANTLAMYRIDRLPAGVMVVLDLLVESCGVGVAAIGIVGVVYLFRRGWRATLVGSAAPLGLVVLAVCLGAGKPAEFARFLLLPAIGLCVAAAALAANLARRRPWLGVLLTLALLGAMKTPAYLRSFARDASTIHESRTEAGAALAAAMQAGESIGVVQVPAPYSIPPLDFTRVDVYLLPPREPQSLDRAGLPDWLVYTADDAHAHADAWWRRDYALWRSFAFEQRSLSRITWADKPVFIYRRR
jgi:hypothetical protein